jgi:Fe2+ or Zn2+ uptake regulation protein
MPYPNQFDRITNHCLSWLRLVYSNLKSLAEKGEIHILSFAGRADRYDRNIVKHYHIRCQSCGNFCDLPAEGIAEVNKQIAEASGYTVKSYEILFNGICPDCKKIGQDDQELEGTELWV